MGAIPSGFQGKKAKNCGKKWPGQGAQTLPSSATEKLSMEMGVVTMFLRYRDLAAKKGITFSRPHIWRLTRAGRFPRAVNLGENSIAWVEEEIDDYISLLIKKRDNPDF